MRFDLVIVVTSLVSFVTQARGVTVHFTQSDYGSVNESDVSFVRLSVERVGRFGSAFTVFVELDEATDDFKANFKKWPITFTPDDALERSVKSVTVSVADDDLPEKDETFEFRLTSSLSKIQIDEPSLAHVTISANDDASGIIGFQSDDKIIIEETAHANTTLQLPLIRHRGSFGDATVWYNITPVHRDGRESQEVNQDLWPLEGVVTLRNGENTGTIDVKVLDDQIPEDDEEFILTLIETASGAVLNETAKSVQIVVKANDSPLRFNQKIYRVQEAMGSFNVKILRGMDASTTSRVGPDNGQVLVDYYVTPGTATPGDDYILRESSTIRFGEQQHEASLRVFLLDDDLPEMSENFTIQLRQDSVIGDAVVAEPMTCTVVIETNDKANGVLSVDFSEASRNIAGIDEAAFIIEEDAMDRFSGLSVLRQGGTFSTVAVDWKLTINGSDGTDVIDDVEPTSGRLVFDEKQTRVFVNFTLAQNEDPSEARFLVFSLLQDSITGGAEIEPPSEAYVIIADSDDVYGVIDIDRASTGIEINDDRYLDIHFMRTGGSVGDVEVTYSASYLPPHAKNIRDSMPGILERGGSGKTVIKSGEDNKAVQLRINDEAFLETDSRFLILLEKVELLDKEPVIPPRSPRLAVLNFTVDVTEPFANGEVGFFNSTALHVDEPSDEEGPLPVTIELQREGLSGEAAVQISYRSVGKNVLDLVEGLDFLRGPDVVIIPAGKKRTNITLFILPDNLPELDEEILIRLDSIEPSNQKLRRSSSEKRVFINENDSPGGVFTFSTQSTSHYVIEEDESEMVTVRVERTKGDLAQRMVQYDVIPDGSRQFYGVPELLVFPPGVRNADFTLVPRDDKIPELDQNYKIVLLPYGNPPSVTSEPSFINVTVLENDHPYGLFVFDDDINAPKIQNIGETKGLLNKTAHFRVSRTMGTFNDVSVSWRIIPNNTVDVSPNHGTLYFRPNATEALISVVSVPDEVPESMEEFTFYLFNATNGADIGERQNATLIIEPNDKAVFFTGPSEVVIDEGGTVRLTIHRDGSGADSTTVRYRTGVRNSTRPEHHATPDLDYKLVYSELVTFQPGRLDVDVTIATYDDDFPEDNEQFFVELFDATEDYVTYGNVLVNVTIEQNDDANGIFSFNETDDVIMSEGASRGFRIDRARGAFGDVTLSWKIFRQKNKTYDEIKRYVNDPLHETEEDDEFVANRGQITFNEGERHLEVVLEARQDSVPEYDENFVLALLNVTDGGGTLSKETELLVTRIVVKMNDHPFGLLAISNMTSLVVLAEDSKNDSDVTIVIDRTMGKDGEVKVLWELHTAETSLPSKCHDLLMASMPHVGAILGEGRPDSNTQAVTFQPDSVLTIVDEQRQIDFSRQSVTISCWIMTGEDVTDQVSSSRQTSVNLLSKITNNGSEIVSIVLKEEDKFPVVRFTYLDDDTNAINQSTTLPTNQHSVSLAIATKLFDAQWHHLVLTLSNKIIKCYVDGQLQDEKVLSHALYSKRLDPTVLQVGPATGTVFQLQDLRSYEVDLTSQQINELRRNQVQDDITPTSGYVTYRPHMTSSNITLRSIKDDITEREEEFVLTLMDASGGATIDEERSTSFVTVLKSDFANGLFGFSQLCLPDHVTEGQEVTCFVNRSRGLHGSVTVEWRAVFNKSEIDDRDFVKFQGVLHFDPEETEKTFNLSITDDEIPEIDELHSLQLINATSLDGVKSSSPHSGAVLDLGRSSTVVVIESNDEPHGVLQFSTGAVPKLEDKGKVPETDDVPIVYVKEEDAYVNLMVVRAAGWFGQVTAEWRTKEGTALSRREPKDFESSAGRVIIKDGEGHASLRVKLIDDEVSELEKFFHVVLSTPTGGASLSNASRVKVVIKPSDDAFGLFQFNKTTARADEPSEGTTTTSLQVVRRGGSLGEASLHWRIRNNSTRDVTPTEGQLTFSEGQLTNDVIIAILSDDDPEFDENIEIELTEVNQGSLGPHTTAILTITANDDPRGLVIFKPTSVIAHEGGDATLFLQRLGGSSGTIRVHFTTMDTMPENRTFSQGIAIPDGDYKYTESSVLIGENVTSINFTIPVLDDVIPERDEVFFVQLTSVELVSSGVEVKGSPRLGSDREILAEVSITENDSPHGVLELSSSMISVPEDDITDDDVTLQVVRRLGTFGDVSVRVTTNPGSARSLEDYNLVQSEVTLLDGESRKLIPIRIIDDFTPELKEDFTVELLHDSVTGGAEVGNDDTCKVMILESDDPYGLLSISVSTDRVEEPAEGRTPVTFTVHRKNGQRGLVGLKWKVYIEPALAAADPWDGQVSSNLADSGSDVDVREGLLYLTTNEIEEEFTVNILADDVAEDDEVIRVRLEEILPGYKGRIDPKHSEAHVNIPANDRPYGDVTIERSSYIAEENEEGRSTVTVDVIRSGGLHGTMRVVYSTLEVDLVSEMMDNQDDLVELYQQAKHVGKLDARTLYQSVDILSSDQPLVTCAEACLRERACLAFLYHQVGYECKWLTRNEMQRGHIEYLSGNENRSYLPARYTLYEKNTTKTSKLYNSQARAGIDFLPYSGASLLLHPGQQKGSINITILPDKDPELNEYFKVSLLNVNMLDVESDLINLPAIKAPSTSRITIEENDHPYGFFYLTDQDGNRRSDVEDKPVEVEERPQLSLEMVVKRAGGSVGDVSVDWTVMGGTALRNQDFTGDDATLKFEDGETRKVISLSVIDDGIPEPSEDIRIQLSNPTGGAQIDQKMDRTRIIILANDVVGGAVGFSHGSRSLIGREGGNVTLQLARTDPALGTCRVTWHAVGMNGHDVMKGLNDTQGVVEFDPGQTTVDLVVGIVSDQTPETAEEYRIVLSDAESLDLPRSGGAIIDVQSSSAQISIEDSDDPHGVFRFAPLSQRINMKEENVKLEIFVTRQFGSIGRVRVYFDVIPGTLSTLNPDIGVAETGVDFTFDERRPYVTFDDGVTSAVLFMNIIDDIIPELNEIFHVNLTRVELIDEYGRAISPVLPPRIDPAGALSQVVIDANDGTKGVVEFDPNHIQLSVDESQDAKVRLRIMRKKGTYGEVSVFIFPQNRKAILGKDYTCEATTLVLVDSQDSIDYEITIINDDIPEGKESFDVLLGNPSAGLELGNFTKATITILSNDDAHGRVAFDNEPLIYLDEPEGLNFTQSKTELTVLRSPPDGVFGTITLRFKIEELTSSGEVIDGPVSDITPVEGYVTIEDGVSFQVIELAAKADDNTELDERFRVTIFDPTNGATLAHTRTSTEIIIKENDAPFGNFTVRPSASRNQSIIRINEDVGLLYVDVLRNQGTLGTVTIDLQTTQGSATPLSASAAYPPFLAPFQTFLDSSGVWFHAFHHEGTSYLIYLTNILVRPLTTRLGGSGTLPTLTPGVHSTLYKWQGVYTPVQTIETDGASCATSFHVGPNIFIFISNSGQDGRRETNSRLYTMEGGRLRVVQDIRTKGASNVAHFHKTTHYLVVANSVDNNRVSSIDSILFRMSESDHVLNQVQTLPTRGASGLETFSINGYLYLAIANRLDSEIPTASKVSSIVYRWDPVTSTFTQRTNVDVSHASDVVHYDADNGDCLLMFTSASSRNEYTTHGPDVIKVFQVLQNDQEGSLLLRAHQSLHVAGVGRLQVASLAVDSLHARSSIQPSVIRSDNVTFLMTSSHTSSKIYFFDHDSLLFRHLFSAGPSSFLYPYSVSKHASALVAVVTNEVMATSSFTMSQVGGDASSSVANKPFSFSGIYNVVNIHTSNGTSNGVVPAGDFISLTKSLTFQPDQRLHTVAINILNDDLPEEDESFKIILTHSGESHVIIDDVSSALEVIIASNDDAHGIIGFVEEFLEKSVEETSNDNSFTLNLLRNVSTFGSVTVDWIAEGNINDITPVSGQVAFEDGQSVTGIQLTVLADDLPEVDEYVTIRLINPHLVGSSGITSSPRLNVTSSQSRVQIPANDSPHGVVRWAPSSLRTVISEAETLSGASQLVTLDMVREQGMMGDIEIHFRTQRADNLQLKSQATPGTDFIPRDSSLVMRENTTRAAVSISIIPDDIPEDIESFYVIIYKVTLIGESTIGGEPGISSGGNDLAEVTIDENDDARGFVQFNVTRNEEGAIDAFELPRKNNSLKLALERVVGFVRTIGVEWVARPGTAKNQDFFPSSGSVQFLEGSKSAEIEIFIADDHEVEFVETFTVQLVAATGGAKLGGDLLVKVNIMPNDSPSGMFGFLQDSYRLEESTTADDARGSVELQVKRFQGSDEDVTLLWKLDDSAHADLSPVSGNLLFPAKTRSKSIILRSLPDQQLEGEESFNIRLIAATGGAEISPVAGNAKVIISANPGAAGKISILTKEIFAAEPEGNYDGIITIMMKRGPGVFGEVLVDWQVTPADQGTFAEVEGQAYFRNLQNETTIKLRTVDDVIPESPSDYVIKLIGASGGATVNHSANKCQIHVVASDHPHGQFELSQPVYHVKESSIDYHTLTSSLGTSPSRPSYVSVAVLRNYGSLGEVALDVHTEPGSALPNVDYYAINKRLVFTDGEAFKKFDVEIIDDKIPEGPKEFFLNITGLQLLSHSDNDYVIRKPFNLSRDSPPLLGDVTWSVVRIAKSDGPEGVVQFAPEASAMIADESDGEIRVPLIRSEGNYGAVSVRVTAINQTARRNVDFLLPSAGVLVTFENEQSDAYVTVPIVDDTMMEGEEKFTLALAASSGGVRLGSRKFSEVTIKKSDYPNGVFRFIGDDNVSIKSPSPGGTELAFTLERFGGNRLPVTVRWRIERTEPFISPTTSNSPLHDDISSPLSGQFEFGDGENGRREILVNILPSDGAQEVEEHFIIVIESASPAEISQIKGRALITVQKKGHPNGVVRFGSSTDENNVFNQKQFIEEPESGIAQLVFPITRQFGSTGLLNVTWSISPINQAVGASNDDVTNVIGSVLVHDGQIDAEILVTISADQLPELEETFLLTLLSVNGGAEIDNQNKRQLFAIRANGDPHGVFLLREEDQRIRVSSNMRRFIQVNVTRDRGLFGRVVVAFEVLFKDPVVGVAYVTTNTGTVVFPADVSWGTEEIQISHSVFLPVGSSFIVKLTSVQYMDPDVNIQPRIFQQHSTAKVKVVAQAGNSQVGFSSALAKVDDVKRNQCQLKITRQGTYGDVIIHWTSGYPVQRAPLDVAQGALSPASGVLTMKHSQDVINFYVTLLPTTAKMTLYALYINRVHSVVGGGARVLKNGDMAEIDPSGAIRFAPFSSHVILERSRSKVNLTIERLYGSRLDVEVFFSVIPLSLSSTTLTPSQRGSVTMEQGRKEKIFSIGLAGSAPGKSESFMVNLTSTKQADSLYQGDSPRIITFERTSHVTIAESANARGVISFADVTIQAKESSGDGSEVNIVMVDVQRSLGAIGDVSVMISTIGGGEKSYMTPPRDKKNAMNIPPWMALKIDEDNSRRASAGLDYEVRDINITFQEGTNSISVPLVIRDDVISEPDEVFFLFLHSTTGGAQVSPVKGLTKVVIAANDVPDGVIGFQQADYSMNDDTSSRSVHLRLTRTHAYGDAIVSWRAITSYPGDVIIEESLFSTPQPTETSPVTWKSREGLSEQLESTHGIVTCPQNQLDCDVIITLKDDELAEFSRTFYVVLYDVTEGAEIDQTRRIANVTIEDSDAPHGLFQFALSSRFPVATKGSNSVGLTVERIGGVTTKATVRYRTQQLRRTVTVTGVTMYPAVAAVDYITSDETIEFNPGERESFISIRLLDGGSTDLPQIFRIELTSPSGRSRLSDHYYVSNVTIVSGGDVKRAWAVYETLQQDLDDSVISDVVSQLHDLADGNLGNKQLLIFHGCLDDVIAEGRRRKLSDDVIIEIYHLFCKLLDPTRTDAVRGHADFSFSFDNFALCMTSQSECTTSDVTTVAMKSCSHVLVQSSRWYPELINGYQFTGSGKEFFQMPADLLDVSKTGVASENARCYDVYFIEYSSSVWFNVEDQTAPMSDKIFSVGVDELIMTSLVTPVRYRIYTNDARISPKGAECVLWNEASQRWLSSERGTCRVVDDTSNYVECECHHMSVYAARGPTDNLAGYNQATYAACFIAIAAFLVTLLGHHLCSRRARFASKLLMHLFFASAVAQLVFAVGALVSRDANQDSCVAIGIFLHYFWLAQFTWIFVHAVNLLQVFAFNDQHSDRSFIIYFMLGWGTPAIAIVVYVMVMYAMGSETIYESYGDVNDNGDMCMILNSYGALLSAIIPACLCIFTLAGVGFYLYQRKATWKNYDDITLGKLNSIEIPLLFWFYFFLAITWLWAGLHLAYGQLWMLVSFIVFNFIQGLYVFVIYGILHSPMCLRNKNVYDETIDKTNDVIEEEYQTSVIGEKIPSISGGDVINKSTQSLMTYEGVWEGSIVDDGNIGPCAYSTKDDSADFDDLIMALKSERSFDPDVDETNIKEIALDSDISRDIVASPPHETDDKPRTEMTTLEYAPSVIPMGDTHL
ncbi:unnamed protein product [Clavelina lepadiformis]|uniref:G-protein coupled receptor 98 n=1 Tax=Clavelina lepadiformis TaxID=159417 RepID=A0ABP0GQX9_CLALP